jgi:hypothetical protein
MSSAISPTLSCYPIIKTLEGFNMNSLGFTQGSMVSVNSLPQENSFRLHTIGQTEASLIEVDCRMQDKSSNMTK